MSTPLQRIRDIIQEDVGRRGLRTDPRRNLINAFPDDFANACRNLAETRDAHVAVVTGFFIPTAEPPAGETDGPLGALFLARALVPLGIKVCVVSDRFCESALAAGLARANLGGGAELVTLPDTGFVTQEVFGKLPPRLTHLIALERVGPNHTPESIAAQEANSDDAVRRFQEEVPAERRDRCHTMRGRDVTPQMAPAHWLFEVASRRVPPITTIGIGDGGNEIGMGKMPWEVIHHNIPNGGLIACRVPTDYLIVCGISNWGAYGLAAGVRLLRKAAYDAGLFDIERERELLRVMVEAGPLVDGVSGKPSVSVDGLAFDRYSQALEAIGTITRS
jgi:hypothetical protein